MIFGDAALFGLIVVAVLSCLALDRYLATRREWRAKDMSDHATERQKREDLD
jgi:hypothetical protein